MPCDNCPCPATCLRWEAFCAWAAEDPPDEVKIRHICARSAMPADEAPAPTPPATTPAPLAAQPSRPDVAESIELLRLAKACAFASRDAACGCSGIRCGLRPPGQQVGSQQQCLECIRKFGA